MPHLLIVTHIDFWRNGAGHRTRISSLINYLQYKINVTIVYAGLFDTHDEQLLQQSYPAISVDVLERNRPITYQEYRIKFESYIQGKKFDFVLVEYIEMSFVLPFLQSDVVTLLDTHDLVHDRIQSFKSNELVYDGIALTKEEEFEIFDCFDYVIAIQEKDYKTVNEQLSQERILLVPHPVSAQKQIPRREVRNIGYIASAYSPNVDALIWFLEKVWQPLDNKHNVVLNVYGEVCNKLPNALIQQSPEVVLHGFLTNLANAYTSCDIMINPVRCGAGLKIKNVEALAYGLPLITTSHGAVGMTDELNLSFLLADTPEEFKLAIDKLVRHYDFRASIGDNAFQYVQRVFSHVRCYQPLLDVILAKIK